MRPNTTLSKPYTRSMVPASLQTTSFGLLVPLSGVEITLTLAICSNPNACRRQNPPYKSRDPNRTLWMLARAHPSVFLGNCIVQERELHDEQPCSECILGSGGINERGCRVTGEGNLRGHDCVRHLLGEITKSQSRSKSVRST